MDVTNELNEKLELVVNNVDQGNSTAATTLLKDSEKLLTLLDDLTKSLTNQATLSSDDKLFLDTAVEM